ncbi:MAG: BspA family leucine-rich repeat surface protein [Paludibacteraceae bacterium]|nr:BspA family leucine-rich repeat surface protein [Paludibacteraceae bacterium]
MRKLIFLLILTALSISSCKERGAKPIAELSKDWKTLVDISWYGPEMNIKEIKVEVQTKAADTTINVSTAEVPIYVSIKDSILTFITEAEEIYLPENSENLFNYMNYVFYEKHLTYTNYKEICANYSGGFASLRFLKSIDLSHFNTSKVKYMQSMFCGCSSLTSLDLSRFNTENVVDMEAMFLCCANLKKLDLSSFNMKKVVCAEFMLKYCFSLDSILTPSVMPDNENKVLRDSLTAYLREPGPEQCYVCPNWLFHFRSNKVYIDLPSRTGWGWSDSKSGLFYTDLCKVPTLSKLSFGKCTKDDEKAILNRYWIQTVYKKASGIDYLDYLAKEHIKVEVKTKTAPHDTMYNVSEGGVPIYVLGKGKTLILQTEADEIYLPEFSDGLFGILDIINDCQLRTIDLSHFNTDRVVSMQGMFWNLRHLDSLDLSQFNTGNVLSMYEMFSQCERLKSIKFGHQKMKNVTDMGRLFYDCSSLSSLDLTSFNMENVTNADGMFYGCEKLNVDLNRLNMKRIEDENVVYKKE